MRQLLIVIVVVAGTLAFPLAPAAASPLLLGETIETTYLFPNTGTIFSASVSTVVGAGTELLGFAGLANIDFSDTNILITMIRPGGPNNVAFDGFRFADVGGTIPAFTSVVINAATNVTGFNATHLSFGPDFVLVNLANLTVATGEVISLDLNRSVSQVPEPTTLLLLSVGLAGVLGCRWGKRK